MLTTSDMGVALRKEDLYVTPEEYLARERISQMKHEYRAGLVCDMAGASFAHNLLVMNILRVLLTRLHGTKCQAFSSDRRLGITRAEPSFFYYPDVVVDCSGSREMEVTDPTVIFEVLSPESAATDRGDKLVNYLAMPSMRVYVLVDQFMPVLTVYRRNAEVGWPMEVIGDPKGTLELPEIGCSLGMADMYANVLPY